MSIMTLRKRIALVAVSALTAGVLAVASAPVASAATDVAAGNVSITSTTGTATANVGICKVTASESATITTAATLTFEATSSSGYFKVLSGPGSFTALTAGTSINSAGDKVVFTATTGTASFKASAVGTVRVTAYTPSDAAVEAYVITVVAKCAADVYAPSESFFRAVTSSAGTATSNADETGSTDIATAGYAYLAIALNDIYGDNLGTAGAIVATATNGALVNINTDAAGASSSAVASHIGDNRYIRIDTPEAGKPVTTTVTVTFNGVAVGTRTFTLRGWGTSLAVTDVTVGKSGTAYTDTSTSGAGSFKYQWKDSAGNVVPGGVVAATTATGLTTLVTAAVGGAGLSVGNTVARAAVSPTTTTDVTSYGDGKYTCTGSTKSGEAKIAVAGRNANQDLVVSNVFTATCGGVLDTWSVSTDKATYAPGEIGTLTITGKDANGAKVTDIQTLTGISGAATIGGGATFVTAPLSTDTFTNGVKTYKFLVGNTEGSYAASVTVTGATDITAKTTQYVVKSPNTTVSNADVLKSIVALIASINKQIQALQKLILRR